MSAQLAAYGRLGQPPKEITTSTGTTMAVGSMAVTLTDRHGDEHTQWLGIVAFGKTAEFLLRHDKGDLLSASGRVQANVYQERVELQIVTDSIVSARSARPGGGRRKSDEENGKAAASEAADAGERDFDDDIPF